MWRGMNIVTKLGLLFALVVPWLKVIWAPHSANDSSSHIVNSLVMICFPVWENHHLRTQNRIRCSCSAHFLAVKSSYACRWTLCLCYSNSNPGCLKLAMLGNFLWTLWICPCFSMQNLQFYISADAKQVDHYQVDAKKIPTQHAPRWSSHFSASTWASSWRDQAGTLCTCVSWAQGTRRHGDFQGTARATIFTIFWWFHSWFQTLPSGNLLHSYWKWP